MEVGDNHPLLFAEAASVARGIFGRDNDIPTRAKATELMCDQGCSGGDVDGKGPESVQLVWHPRLEL